MASAVALSAWNLILHPSPAAILHRCFTHIANPVSNSALGGTIATIPFIVFTGIISLATITSRLVPFSRFPVRLPKNESRKLPFRWRPITRAVTSYSLIVCMIPEVIFISYRLTISTFTFAADAIFAAVSRLRRPSASLFGDEPLSLMTLSATIPSFRAGFFTTSARLTRFSTVSGFATGMSSFSASSGSRPVPALFSISKVNFLAARSVTIELITQVKSIITMVPFSTLSFSSLSPFSRMIPCPMSTAARVAAAWALLSPNIILLSVRLIP